MNEFDFEEIISNKQFSYSLQGYNPKQVDRYLKKMISYYKNAVEENKVLQEKINEYEKHEKYIRQALIRTEQTCEEVKEKTSKEAEEIIAEAKNEAMEILQSAKVKADKVIELAELDSKLLRDSVTHNQTLYEEETKKLIGSLYYKFRHKLTTLEDELIQEVDQYVNNLEQNLLNSNKKAHFDNKDSLKVGDNWALKEEALLVGCELKHDITDNQEQVIFPKSTIVTPQMIREMIDKNMYGELLEAIEDCVKADVK